MYSRHMGDFKRLVAWQQANILWQDIQRIFSARSAAMVPGLRAQIVKSASSVRQTLAEGSGKNSRPEMKRFAGMAYTSAKEIEDQLLQGRDAGVLSQDEYLRLEELRDHVARLCFGLMNMRD